MSFVMRLRLKQGLLAVFTLVLLLGAHAHAALEPVPALQTRVTDLTQTLNADQQAQLEAKLAGFEQETGSQ
ncbi:MAG: YgcG family protein, partial [Methylotenera sp.]